MFKELMPAGRGINTGRASGVLGLSGGARVWPQSCLGDYALKQIGVWEIITTFLPNTGAGVRFSEERWDFKRLKQRS